MRRKLPGPLVEGMMTVAEQLAQASGPAAVRQASMRRGVSSAYYALFHALCTLCADELVGWSKTRSLPPIYRSLDHGLVLKKLRSRESRLIDPSIETIGALFQNLQEKRHAADYAPPSALFRASARKVAAGFRKKPMRHKGLEHRPGCDIQDDAPAGRRRSPSSTRRGMRSP